jgi:UDPglucose 6-dehydrogenase
MKIGLVGLGFVGSSVKNAYDVAGIETVCLDPGKGIVNPIEKILETDAIFVAVPSPKNADGSCDTTILENILADLKSYQGVIISKVTAPPDVYKALIELYPNLIHAPEFLVASTAKQDYLDSEFAIVGGNLNYCQPALDVIKLGQPKISEYRFCSIEEASLSKYAINCFLSTKVIFMNQLKDIAEGSAADFNVIKDCIKLDKRLGYSHFDVPGPDGSLGFGGACFPKDTASLNFYSKSINKEFTLLDKVIEINNEIKNR